jgi:signal transduction histidine kinase
VIDAVPAAILVVDEYLRILVVNAATRQLLNLGDSSYLGYSAARFLSFDKLQAACQVLLSRMGRLTYRDSIRLENVTRHVEIAADLLFEDGMKFVCLTIEDRTHLERELSEWRYGMTEGTHAESEPETTRDGPAGFSSLSAPQLERAHHLEALGQLTSTLAHDFNNLLTVIQTSLETAKLRIARGIDPGEDIDRALIAVEKSVQATGQILEYARDSGTIAKSISPLEILKRLSDLLRRAVGDAAHLEMDLFPTANVRLREAQLETAVLNLVVNARDALERNGQIRVVLSGREVDDTFGAQLGIPPGRYVCVSVSDNGIGMSSALRQRVFEPFFTTKPSGTGTGLGLSAVRSLTERAGGAVILDSRPGHGTRVEMLFPEEA